MVRTPLFQGGNRGSIPRGAAMTDNKENEISWRAAEFNYTKKAPLWFFVVGAVSLFLFLFSFLRGNFFFAVFLAIAGVIVIFLGNRRPRVIDFGIGEEGVFIEDSSFTFDSLSGFAFQNKPGKLDEIVLKKKTDFNPYLKLPIDSKTAEKVRPLLESKLPEIEYEESLIDILAERLGF